MKQQDIYFIQKTFQLAQKARGKTSPNPLVGAVVVKKGKIVGEGFHRRCGLAHAEAVALKKAGSRAKGATLYVNLEPCFSFGRTPPCVNQIIKAGLKRVVVAVKDPNLQVAGKSIRKLKENNIDVSLGVCRGEAIRLNEIFFKNMRKGLPFVAAKVASSLDGKIATKSGQSKWITGKPARNYSRKLRDNYDAVMIGAGTLRKDNPRLNGIKKIPRKIILSASLGLPANTYLFKHNPANLIIFASQEGKKNNKLPKTANIFFFKQTKNGLPLKKILKKLYSLGVTSVFLEGGSYTLGKFFKQKLVDKVYFFLAPKIMGGKDSLAAVGATGFGKIKESVVIKDLEIKRIGEDILFQGRLK